MPNEPSQCMKAPTLHMGAFYFLRVRTGFFGVRIGARRVNR